MVVIPSHEVKVLLNNDEIKGAYAIATIINGHPSNIICSW